MGDLNRTGLYDLHLQLGAKMVPFAGYEMPVQYPMGVMKEHLHCRAAAGLFDVGHMGQVILRGPDFTTIATALEALVPASVLGLAEGRQRLGLFTNAQGGIEDDLMFANRGDHLYLVVNAARKADDLALLRAGLPKNIEIEAIEDRALIALQGPQAEDALAQLVPDVRAMRFMDVTVVNTVFGALWISRSGYTGEDGFEISLPNAAAPDFARALLAIEAVAPIGLGARDSLRLEAGLCLYGHDLDETTSPVEAALEWVMQKPRLQGGARAGGFPGADRIFDELAQGAPRRRVGLLPEGRAPMREGVPLFASDTAGVQIGTITSGTFAPSLNAPIAMGYVDAEYAANGTPLWGELRGKRQPLSVTALPFRPATYKR